MLPVRGAGSIPGKAIKIPCVAWLDEKRLDFLAGEPGNSDG